jgi:hypothetical protein
MVVAVSGEYLVCRAPGGFEFRVRLHDILMGRGEKYDAQPDEMTHRGPSRTYRLTAKGMEATTGKLFALPGLPS